MATSILVINNDDKVAHVVYVEPYPDDFTLLPGEQLELHAWSSDNTPRFELCAAGWATAVYIVYAEMGDYRVEQNGVKLEPGHNKQAAIDAGYWV